MQVGDQCTLRAAIMQANATTGPHTIVLPLNATITLTLNGVGGAESGDLDILQPMTITGALLGFPVNFNELPRIQANFSDRVFDIGQGVAVTLRGLQLTDGDPSGVAGTNGGALRITNANANVLVDRVRIAENFAATGAGISNSGTLVVEGSDLVANIASTGAQRSRPMPAATPPAPLQHPRDPQQRRHPRRLAGPAGRHPDRREQLHRWQPIAAATAALQRHPRRPSGPAGGAQLHPGRLQRARARPRRRRRHDAAGLQLDPRRQRQTDCALSVHRRPAASARLRMEPRAAQQPAARRSA
jgi:hypothetical protein